MHVPASPPPSQEEALTRLQILQTLRDPGGDAAFNQAYAAHGDDLAQIVERWRYDLNPGNAALPVASGWKPQNKSGCKRRFVTLTRELAGTGVVGPGWEAMKRLIAFLDERAVVSPHEDSFSRLGEAFAAATLSATLREGRWHSVACWGRWMKENVVTPALGAAWEEVWTRGALPIIRSTLAQRRAIQGGEDRWDGGGGVRGGARMRAAAGPGMGRPSSS